MSARILAELSIQISLEDGRYKLITRTKRWEERTQIFISKSQISDVISALERLTYSRPKVRKIEDDPSRVD